MIMVLVVGGLGRSTCCHRQWQRYSIVSANSGFSSKTIVLPSSPSHLSTITNKYYFRVEGLKSFPFFKSGLRLRPASALPENGHSDSNSFISDDDEQGQVQVGLGQNWKIDILGNSGILSSCLVGLLTGLAVVLFNNSVHEIRDFFWDGIPYRGASWLREEPIQAVWTRVVLVPACGGLIVSLLKLIIEKAAFDMGDQGKPLGASAYIRKTFRPFLNAVAACVTLGTGNSLGPEGPSVEIGSSIAKGLGSLFDKSSRAKLSLLAAGSAAGLSSGFNASVAGCFFAVESVIWPSPGDSSLSLTNTTSMVILSAVIASVISEVGLGSEPAFRIPEYDFRSLSATKAVKIVYSDIAGTSAIPMSSATRHAGATNSQKLPLYLLLGILCGLVSLALSRCTSYFLMAVDSLHNPTSIPKALLPVLGGLSVGLIALAYPEILYWGFENVDILLESRPFVKGLSTDVLLQLIAVKIFATSLCRASGLVGGYYAPSLFIGAATGMAYGKLVDVAITEISPTFHLSMLEVASPQAYGLVGMAATLAGVCQVPLTAVLLLFELTQDYRIVLPLLGAVGMSSWVTSRQTRRKELSERCQYLNSESKRTTSGSSSTGLSESYSSNLCEVESSLCVEDENIEMKYLEKRTSVSEAMRTRFLTILMSTLLTEVVTLMLVEKQSCALIVDTDGTLIGLLTLEDIQDYGRLTKVRNKRPKELLVSELCSMDGEICRVPWVATSNMDLLSAQMNMKKHGICQVPVVRKHLKRVYPVGILDIECISLTCRALATKESLS